MQHWHRSPQMFHEQRHIILGKILRDRSVLVRRGNRHCQKLFCLKCIYYYYRDGIQLNWRSRSQALWTPDKFDSNPPIAQFKMEVFMISSLFGTQGQLMFQGFKCRLYLRILSINSEWHLSITSHKSLVNTNLPYLLFDDFWPWLDE